MSIPVLIEGQRYKVAPHGRPNLSLYSFIGTFVERIDVAPTPSRSSTVHFKFTDCIKQSGEIIPEFIIMSPRLFEFVLQAPEPVGPGPLANTPSVSKNDLVKGEYYHVWTQEGSEFKHEGHGKFFGLQNAKRDALFQPFIIESGAVLESQVFSVSNSYFYKITNIKGGKRKTRKCRKSRKNTRRRRMAF